MPRKCSIWGCRSGYCTSTTKANRRMLKETPDAGTNPFRQNVSIYGFPRDPEEKLKWVQNLPYKLDIDQITGYMGVCANHWPPGSLTPSAVSKGRGPADPPSIFPDKVEKPRRSVQPGSTQSRIMKKFKMNQSTSEKRRSPKNTKQGGGLFLQFQNPEVDVTHTVDDNNRSFLQFKSQPEFKSTTTVDDGGQDNSTPTPGSETLDVSSSLLTSNPSTLTLSNVMTLHNVVEDAVKKIQKNQPSTSQVKPLSHNDSIVISDEEMQGDDPDPPTSSEPDAMNYSVVATSSIGEITSSSVLNNLSQFSVVAADLDAHRGYSLPHSIDIHHPFSTPEFEHHPPTASVGVDGPQAYTITAASIDSQPQYSALSHPTRIEAPTVVPPVLPTSLAPIPARNPTIASALKSQAVWPVREPVERGMALVAMTSTGDSSTESDDDDDLAASDEVIMRLKGPNKDIVFLRCAHACGSCQNS